MTLQIPYTYRIEPINPQETRNGNGKRCSTKKIWHPNKLQKWKNQGEA